ncbi:hypothetical protein BK674_08105 [Pseudomonas moraviensis]|uniref:Uncharacterized protein n=1 Tax=Pseudomonas moraviensis TaxID=321662 RepID=A0A423NQL2_9PSED|nr:hypothetical protein BK674_08105 [Pseudomonas moraviensis]
MLHWVSGCCKSIGWKPLHIFRTEPYIQHVRSPFTISQATSIAIYGIYFFQHAVVPAHPLVMIQGSDALSIIQELDMANTGYIAATMRCEGIEHNITGTFAPG